MSCTKKHALTPHSGRSFVGGSGSRKRYMCRARNIGYIVLLAGARGVTPEGPLKGSAALERTHYIHLQGIRERDRRAQRTHTGERKRKREKSKRKRIGEGRQKKKGTHIKRGQVAAWREKALYGRQLTAALASLTLPSSVH